MTTPILSRDLIPPRALLRKVRDGLRGAGIRIAVDLTLARPCAVAWESMAPVAEGVRRCADCDAPVYDFTGLSRRQIVARVRAHGGSVCGQVVARSDGRLVFGACTADDGGRVRGGLTLTSRG